MCFAFECLCLVGGVGVLAWFSLRVVCLGVVVVVGCWCSSGVVGTWGSGQPASGGACRRALGLPSYSVARQQHIRLPVSPTRVGHLGAGAGRVGESWASGFGTVPMKVVRRLCGGGKGGG